MGGAECLFANGATVAGECTFGEGSCVAPVNCVGKWTHCDSSCTKSFVIMQSPAGAGEQCDYDDGAVLTCLPGEDECPAITEAPTSSTTQAPTASTTQAPTSSSTTATPTSSTTSTVQLTNEPSIQLITITNDEVESGASGFPLFLCWVILALYSM